MLHREIQDAMRELAERFNLHNFKKSSFGIAVPCTWFLWNNYLLNDHF